MPAFTSFDGIPPEAWKVLSTKSEGIGTWTDLFNQVKKKKRNFFI
jgi:hypothetical protein